MGDSVGINVGLAASVLRTLCASSIRALAKATIDGFHKVRDGFQ